MLEKLDLTKSMSKADYKAKMEEDEPKLGELERECKDLQIPVMIAFEGFDAAGKGVQIHELMRGLDPRGFEVFPVKQETEEEEMHPFLWRFWTRLPARGRFAIFDSSWYRKVMMDRFDGKTQESEVDGACTAINNFEKQLCADGMVMIKIFLAIDQEEQKKRFDDLLSSKDSAWRVSEADLKRNEGFDRYQEIIEEALARTNTEYAPWFLVEATDRRYAAAKIYDYVIDVLQKKVDEVKSQKEQGTLPVKDPGLDGKYDRILEQADLSLSLTEDEYKDKIKKLQKKLGKLHGEIYRRRIPVVLGFEGWDAAGKGGAIKRLTEPLDPRGYVVHPTSAANDYELAHQYLWRFWRAFPKAGHITIFDRTWYGRVMVERLEGFCTKDEWQRAYDEINDMEKDLADSGAIVIKFWLQIDKDEQERRFRARESDPKKQWKITDEDWRNRDKWDMYDEAVNEMILRTSTPYAPWVVVEGDNKYYARVKVLQTVVDAIEARLKELDPDYEKKQEKKEEKTDKEEIETVGKKAEKKAGKKKNKKKNKKKDKEKQPEEETEKEPEEV